MKDATLVDYTYSEVTRGSVIAFGHFYMKFVILVRLKMDLINPLLPAAAEKIKIKYDVSIPDHVISDVDKLKIPSVLRPK